jgi:hypothetical protein
MKRNSAGGLVNSASMEAHPSFLSAAIAGTPAKTANAANETKI